MLSKWKLKVGSLKRFIPYVMLLYSVSVLGQNIIPNGGFEAKDSLSNDFIVHNGEVKYTETKKYSGSTSLVFSANAPEQESAVLYTSVRRSSFYGDSLSCSIRLLAAPGDTGKVGFFANQFNGKGEIVAQTYEKMDPSTEEEWQRKWISTPLAPDCEYMMLGVVVIGEAVVYLDDIMVEDGLPAKARKDLSEAEYDYLSGLVEPFDAGKVADWVGESSVIALGENTHGASEIQHLRKLIIGELFEKHDVCVVVEDDAILIDEFKEAVVAAPTRRKQLMSDYLSAYMVSEENASLFQTLIPLDPEAKETLFGMDFQRVKSSQKYVEKFILEEMVNDSVFTPFRNNFDLVRFERNESNYDYKYNRNAIKSLAIIDTIREYSQNDPSLRKHLTHLSQFIKYDGETRDRYMAVNVENLLKEECTEVVVLAHNEHVKDHGYSMGKYLKEKYDSDYQSVGILFGNGSFWGKGEDGFATYQLPQIQKGSLEYHLSQIADEAIMIDLEKVRNDQSPLLAWMNQNVLFRTIGIGLYGRGYSYRNISSEFDFLIYLPEITPIDNFYFRN